MLDDYNDFEIKSKLYFASCDSKYEKKKCSGVGATYVVTDPHERTLPQCWRDPHDETTTEGSLCVKDSLRLA